MIYEDKGIPLKYKFWHIELLVWEIFFDTFQLEKNLKSVENSQAGMD